MNFKLYFICLLILASVNGCKHAVNQKTTKNNFAKSLPKTRSFNKEKSDTLTINSRSAVAIMLDTPELEKRRKRYGDEAFETGADDAVYYSNITDSVLKAKNLTIIHPISYRYLKFVQSNGSITFLKIDTLSQIYSLFFFDRLRAPYNIDVTAVEDEYNNKFGK